MFGLAREGQLERAPNLMKDGAPEYLFVGVVGGIGGIGGTSTGAVLNIDST